MSDMTTATGGYFPSHDITHKPKRTQAGNLAAAGVASIATTQNAPFEGDKSSIPLQSVSLERAIAYYEANAKGEYAVLYANTAKWLRQLLAIDRYEVRKALEAENKENSNETGKEKAD